LARRKGREKEVEKGNWNVEKKMTSRRREIK
jgi:hypothetical protein